MVGKAVPQILEEIDFVVIKVRAQAVANNTMPTVKVTDSQPLLASLFA